MAKLAIWLFNGERESTPPRSAINAGWARRSIPDRGHLDPTPSQILQSSINADAFDVDALAFSFFVFQERTVRHGCTVPSTPEGGR